MDGWKSTLSSRTVWSQIIGILAFGLTIVFGVSVDPSSQQLIVDGMVGAIGGAITAFTQIAGIIFRIAATKKLGAGPAAPLAALMLAFAVANLMLLLVLARPASAHEWFDDHRYTTAGGAPCCNGRDCKPYDAANVTVTPQGYLLHDGVRVPFAEAHISQDRSFWRCDWGGAFRCLFVVVGGS